MGLISDTKLNQLLYRLVGTIKQAWCLQKHQTTNCIPITCIPYSFGYKNFITKKILVQVAGYSVMIASFSLQVPIRWVVARLHGTPRLLLADVYHFVSFIATVNIWRGVWGMLDTYMFPGKSDLLFTSLYIRYKTMTIKS